MHRKGGTRHAQEIDSDGVGAMTHMNIQCTYNIDSNLYGAQVCSKLSCQRISTGSCMGICVVFRRKTNFHVNRSPQNSTQ